MFELQYATGSKIESSFHENIIDAINDADWMIHSDENVEPISIHEIIRTELWNHESNTISELYTLSDNYD
jgi:hypothetical protein